MLKDCWIYQRAKTDAPWAMYAVKVYEPGGGFENVELDVTFYSERIDNEEHMLSFLDWHKDTVSEYVGLIGNIVLDFGGKFEPCDAKHVEAELCKLFFN